MTAEKKEKVSHVKSTFLVVIILASFFGVYITFIKAVSNNVELIITNNFLDILVGISTSFFSIFSVITFFVYQEINHLLEITEKEKPSIPKKKYVDGEEKFDFSPDSLKKYEIKLNKLKKLKSQILHDFLIAIVLNIFSLSYILGGLLVPENTYRSLLDKISLIGFGMIPMFTGMGLMLWIFRELIIIRD
jgi:hypothetical protein